MPAPQITQTLVAPQRGSGGAAYTATADAFAAALPAWAAQANAQADYLDSLALAATGTGNFTNITATGTVTAAGRVILPITQATPVATTSGTVVNFTGIPSTASRVTVMFNGVSTSGTDNILVQIGTSAGVEASLYASTAQQLNAGTTNVQTTSAETNGFMIPGITAGNTYRGMMRIEKFDASSNTWIATLILSGGTGGGIYNIFGSGIKTLAGTLDRVRVNLSGANSFDAGSINIAWE